MNETPSLISFADLIGVPIVLITIFILFTWAVPKFITNKKIREAFYFGLVLRFVGVMCSLLFYTYIEKEGDTHSYFKYARIIASAFSKCEISEIFSFFVDDYSAFSLHLKTLLPTTTFFSDTLTGNTLMVQIASIVCYFTFDSYIAMSIVFSVWGYIGVWLIFYKLYKFFPYLYKQLYFFIICWPSLFFFGCGVLKEPLCLGALGVLFYFMFTKLKNVKYKFFMVIGILISSLMLINIKPYIFISFIVAYLCAAFFYLVNKISYKFLQRIMLVSLPIIIATIVFFLILQWSSFIHSLAVQKVITFIFITTKAQLTLGNSGYDLGILELTPDGMLTYILKSINVSLFRPFLFEINKVQLLISGLESLTMLMMGIYCFYKVGFKSFSIIKNNPTLVFCLVFVLVLAVQIGAISFNYGTLVRYKMPLLPFYFTFLLLLKHKSKELNY